MYEVFLLTSCGLNGGLTAKSFPPFSHGLSPGYLRYTSLGNTPEGCFLGGSLALKPLLQLLFRGLI